MAESTAKLDAAPAGGRAGQSLRGPASSPPHAWRFHRVGGLDQVVLETGADLAHLDQLDPKLWVALSCPTQGLEMDARTLELLDTDRDGRVRVPEVLAAIRWCAPRLQDLGQLIPGADALPLDALDRRTPEGRALLGGARQLLEHLGKPDATEVTVADVADTSKVFEKTLFNGDGIVPPEAADAPEVRQLLAEVVDCVGAKVDRSGKPGVDQERLDLFFEELRRFVAWWADVAATEGAMPLGPATPAAWEAVRAVRPRVNDYFARCQLAALDPKGAAALNRGEAEWAALAAKDLGLAVADVAAFPLARVEPGRALPLLEGVNPAWASALAALHRHAVAPLLGAEVRELTLDAWRRLEAELAAHEAWQGRKAGAAVEKLGLLRAQALLGGDGKAAVEALLAKDRALEAEAAAVGDVVRMVHYQRDLHRLLRNFVAFSDFYDVHARAVFQAGTLFLDGRSCDLCVRVNDPAAHAGLASLSRMYLAYCECRRPGGAQLKIAACFTQGDADFLMVGRNGVFFDRQGRDWDATIVKIVDNPISIRQAFFAPYKKALKLIEEQVHRFAASKAKASDDRVANGIGKAADAVVAGKPPAPEPVDVGKMVGIVAALGVGIGALGTLFGGFVSGFLNLQPWWTKLAAVAGVVLLVSGPSMLIAWLKLRQRTLGPVLDANGWAINGRVKVNLPLGTALTARAALPAGASRSLEDPYEDRAARRRRRLLWLVPVAVAAALAAARFAHRWPFGPSGQ
ncbi:hypothetical protein [Anaeromyxobacter diazotrophicus]|uniref:EF-hand domain-containing protein n=1 Tax=Anaeromyxobacter diazotrophicus TaxID=2590199 RepID=A0A7I9VIA7_9BACT|nr:hypothetical protein [Anaeromyxobacter diazotrophicus]GEJ55989.1 hypothetical protein AMYX_07300 [Anaeromyxobacter diazotrophicus]